MRFVLDIAYRGTAYHGWQVQENAHTVQAELNAALQTLLQQPGLETIGSGRTDTGVHAEQQFVQFDVGENSTPNTQPAEFVYRLNAILPKDIFVKNLYSAADNFSVRHDAVSRSYEYRISRSKNPFLIGQCCYFYKRELDIEKMNSVCPVLLQHSDFQSFSKYHTDVGHYRCTIEEAVWKEENGLLVFHITANRFLRGMVRAIVGTLLNIGTRKMATEEMENILAQKDRKAAGHAAPPEGLFLTRIVYRPGALKLIG